VEAFAAPAEVFESRVGDVRLDITDLKEKLDDLKNNSDKTADMIRRTEVMNFRNSDPPAAYKTSRISALQSAAR